jgi:hypothetical protein
MIVSEAYLRFEPYRRVGSMRELGTLLFPIIEAAAHEFFTEFPYERKGQIIIEAGSLRNRGIVRVTAAALTAFIGYGGVRQAIDYARRDGQAAASWINEQVRGRLSLESRQIVAQRRFTPAPTRLRSLFDSVAADHLSPQEAAAKAEQLFRHYGETEEVIQRVMEQLQMELMLTPRSGGQRRNAKPPRDIPSRAVALPGKRVNVFRDQSGVLRIVED